LIPSDSVLIIGSQSNPYNNEGLDYFRELELLADTIDNGYLLTQEEKELYIEDNFIDSVTLSESEIEMFKVYFTNIDFNYENATIIEKAFFLYSCVPSFAEIVATCTWQCS
jgi:hypothetical protein